MTDQGYAHRSHKIAPWPTRLLHSVLIHTFLLYFIVSGIGLFIRGRFGIPMFRQQTFRNRINVAMISILTFTIVLIGLGTVMYVVQEYRTIKTTT